MRLTLHNKAIWYPMAALLHRRFRKETEYSLEHPVNLLCKVFYNLFEIKTRPNIFGMARLFQSVDIFKSLTNKIKPLHCPSVMLVITSVTLTDFTSPQIMKSYWKHVQHLLMNNHHVYFAFAWANTNQIWSNFASLETWLYCSLIKHIKLLGILLDTMVSFRKYENDCYFYLGPGLYDLHPLGRHAQCCHCSAVSPRQSDKIFQNNIFIFSW